MHQISKKPEIYISIEAVNFAKDLLSAFLKIGDGERYGLSLIWSETGSMILESQYTEDLRGLKSKKEQEVARSELKSRIDKHGQALPPHFLVGVDQISKENENEFKIFDGVPIRINIENYTNKKHNLINVDPIKNIFFMSERST